MARPKSAAGTRHLHDMRPSRDGEDILKCASCLFRCANDPRVVKLVKEREGLHLVVTHRSPESLKAVYRG